MSAPFGPFSVEPEQIIRLGTSFTSFVNKLLDVEVAAQKLAGSQLSTTCRDTIADGGVDAEVRGATGGQWLPAGDSAWQFKRGDLPPKECQKELKGARWAQDLIRAGAKYRLILGVDLQANKIAARRKALVDEAIDLGLPHGRDIFEVIDANQLARWASGYPSLAVAKILQGPGRVALDFDSWSSSGRHQSPWVAAERAEFIELIHEALLSSESLDIRVDGDSGIGKSRLIMETFRGTPLEPLVAYIPDAEDLASELIHHLLAHGRSTVLVVDECSSRRHEKLAEIIPAKSVVKLLSIGEPDGYPVRSQRQLRVPSLSESAIDDILVENWPLLWPEARRFVVTHAAGNVRTALILGQKIHSAPDVSINDLLQGAGIPDIVSRILGDGDFLAAAILAAFRRVGWEGDLAAQVQGIAASMEIPLNNFTRAAHILESHGFIQRHGRYRSVGPHPVAIYLAGYAWRELGDQLLYRLLPDLGAELTYSFFQRTADLGDFEPTRSALRRLLDDDGPFGTLEILENGGAGVLLTQIAIVAPEETSRHLAFLIQDTESDQLVSLRNSRRDLVWTLEKLVWHSRLFEESADTLLALACNETEKWSNNATGVWVALFGALLPGTSAKPIQRLEYLKLKAASPNIEVRRVCVDAASHGLDPHETITVSGELQGGVLVEPRGMPDSYGEAFDYQVGLIDVLAELLDDSSAEIAQQAESALIRAIHRSLTNRTLLDAIIRAIRRMNASGLRRVRAETEHLANLFAGVGVEDGRPDGLMYLRDNLPPVTPLDYFEVLAQLERWDFDRGELRDRIEQALREIDDAGRERVFTLLQSAVPASWEIGHAIAIVWERSDETVIEKLISLALTNMAPLVGYLWGRLDSGDSGVFDTFLQSEMSTGLPAGIRVAVAVRGPATRRGIERVLNELKVLPPAEGAPAVFGWHRELSDSDISDMLVNWASRITSQQDYNTVVDVVNLMLRDRSDLPVSISSKVRDLVRLRSEFPDVNREAWDWARLAEHNLSGEVPRLIGIILDVIDSGNAHVHKESPDGLLLRRCVDVAPQDSWNEISRRLEAGSWKLEISIRGWLISDLSVDVVAAWVGEEVSRARKVASIAAVGKGEPNEIARFLLDRFGDDDRVAGNLAGGFISGFWWGNESDRISRQMQQLEGWLRRPGEPKGVRSWAKQMMRDLEESRKIALQREAESRD